MDYEVLVVGGGLGGLSVAALLAARGVSVCLFERQWRPGGCVANFEHLGYSFEPTARLYSGWEAGGIYERIFSELPIKPPEVRRQSPAYVVRLPDHTDVAMSEDSEQFEAGLCLAFPECASAAVSFYRKIFQVGKAASADSFPDLTTAHLADCSSRFQRFIDVQLQTLTQCASDRCSFLRAASALISPLKGMWAIRGGAQALADALAESLRQSGGKLRLDSPVLRLAYGSDGVPIGVDLLSGERVLAKRAIISNLTIWDTYGKLIGLGRVPRAVSAQLKQLHAWGVYLLFLGMDKTAASRLKSNTMFVLTDWQHGKNYEADQAQLTFSASPQWHGPAPEDKVAVTVSAYTNAEEWFTFHEDASSHEQQDQATLELLWSRLHQSMPELGDSIEVIETSTPRTFYETTRRRFGLAGKLCPNPEGLFTNSQFGTTIFRNVFMVGDTACPGFGIDGISASALALADALALR